METKSTFHYIKIAIFILIAYVIQTTVVRYIAIRGITPNLVYVTVICYCIRMKDVRVMFVCLATGLFVDMMGSMPLGMSAIMYMLIGTVIAFIAGKYFIDHIVVVFLTVVAATFVYELFSYIVLEAMWGRGSFFKDLLLIILPISAYNGVASIICYFMLHKNFCE